MSWDQDYIVPTYLELLIQLTGKHPQELLEQELVKQGLSVKKAEQILLTEGYFQDVYGTKVTLSDGHVYIPKLTETYIEHGNYGRDTYEWFLASETPEVKHVDGDHSNPQVEPGLDDPAEYDNNLSDDEICSGYDKDWF